MTRYLHYAVLTLAILWLITGLAIGQARQDMRGDAGMARDTGGICVAQGAICTPTPGVMARFAARLVRAAQQAEPPAAACALPID